MTDETLPPRPTLKQLREQMREAGIPPDSPLGLTLLTAVQISQRAADTVERGAHVLTSDEKTELIRRVSDRLAQIAQGNARRALTTLRWQIAVQLLVVMAGLLAVGVSGGYAIGAVIETRHITETEDGLREAFRHGPSAAATWLLLMRSNDPARALALCRKHSTVDNGRAACSMPVWLDGPVAATTVAAP